MTEHTTGPWVGFADQGKLVAIMPAGREGNVCTFAKAPSDRDGTLMTLAPTMLYLLRRIEDEAADGNEGLTRATLGELRGLLEMFE
jgi:hypothetical protein